ncbi:MAG: hypothetical protein MJ201_00210 [Mycoplasmoidaceae bacterium]|nr:hypothetical protein [Mycoplasmoidaceae bacterium]
MLQGNTSIRTYHLKLDDQTSTGLYLSYAKQQPKSRLVDFEFRVVQRFDGTIPQKIQDLNRIVTA